MLSRLWSSIKLNWRLYAAIALAFALTNAASYCQGRSDGKATAELSVAKKDAATQAVVRSADEKVAVSHAAKVSKIEADAAERAAKTEEVLANEASWSNDPIPDAVLERLRP